MDVTILGLLRKLVRDAGFTAGAIKGDPGPEGKGVPKGGVKGQMLRKASSTDYDTEWAEVQAVDVPSIIRAEVQGITNAEIQSILQNNRRH